MSLLRLVEGDNRASAPDLITASASPPAVTGSRRVLFGREPDLCSLRERIAGHRLVSIVGTGGVGKTALAHALAKEWCDDSRGDVCIVDLAWLTDADQLIPSVVTALHASVVSGAAIDAVVDKLAHAPSLLVLDNCEHLLRPVAQLVTALLDAVPLLRVLSTSQEALNLHEEQVYRLGTLAVPGRQTPLGEARATGAIALFTDRAHGADQNFSLDAGNLEAVMDICRDLDGLPLAIELAAARIRLLGVEGLRARLGERLRLLTGGPIDQSTRHRTLRAALEWSHALLTADQAVVFRRLGVMAGSFDIRAAQGVTADADLSEWAVLDALAALVDKSLVTVHSSAAAEPRFHLLETVRHFARDRLAAAAEEGLLRERHLACFLTLAESASNQLAGPQQGEWLARLDLDRDNLFAAHRTCDLVPNGAALGLRLVNALNRYWFNRGAILTGQRFIEEATNRPGADLHGPDLAAALLQSGRLHSFRGLDAEAVRQYTLAIEVGRMCGADGIVVESLARLGYAHMGLNDRAAARRALEQACALSLSAPENRRSRAIALSNLAELERLEGHHQAAAPLYEQVLSSAQTEGDRQATMIAHNNLSMVALARRDLARTRAHLFASLAICDELDSRRGRLVVMEVCAGLASDTGQWQTTMRFDAGARFHTLQLGRRRDIVDEAFLAPRIERARQALGKADLARAQAEGEALPYDRSIEEMRRWLDSQFDSPDAGNPDQAGAGAELAGAVSARVDPRDATQLTPRERETLALIARGYSNNEIAGLLSISVLTVRTHRQRLMEKLELRNSAEITACAVRLGLYDPT